MRRSVAVPLIVAIGLILASCRTEGEKGKPIFGNESLRLSSAQIDELTLKANEGDGDAAFLLYEHYSFIRFDEAEGEKWLRKAVASGNQQAMQHMGVIRATRAERRRDADAHSSQKDEVQAD